MGCGASSAKGGSADSECASNESIGDLSTRVCVSSRCCTERKVQFQHAPVPTHSSEEHHGAIPSETETANVSRAVEHGQEKPAIVETDFWPPRGSILDNSLLSLPTDDTSDGNATDDTKGSIARIAGDETIE